MEQGAPFLALQAGHAKEKEYFMAGTSLVISILALFVAYAAYKKGVGSIRELACKVDSLGLTTETLRRKTAEILETFEKRIRDKEKQ